MLPEPKSTTTETRAAKTDAGDLLSEITQKTVDLRDKLGKRWGIVATDDVDLFARSFISSKSQFGWEIVHQFETICHELDLNPARKEVAAFYSPDKGLTTFVMIDGWLTLANRHPSYDGYKLHENRNEKGELVSIRCEIFRVGRGHPTEATVKMSEWRVGGSAQWMSKPEWMLGMKALKQGIRLAFGFAGVTDEDEALSIYREPEPKAESKGPKIDDLKAATAPPVDEYDRKKVEPPKEAPAPVVAPTPSLKLEDVKAQEPSTQPARSSEVERAIPGEGAGSIPAGPSIPQAAPEVPKPAPKPEPILEPKAKPYVVTEPDFNTPVICGRKGQDFVRRAPADMTVDEIKFALAYNLKSLASAKKQETIDKLKKVEGVLVEVAQAKGIKGEDIGLEAAGPAEAPAPTPVPTPVPKPEPAAPAPQKGAAVTRENAKALGDWVKSRRMALRKAMGVCANECGVTAMMLQQVEAGNVEVVGQLSDFSIERLAETLREPDDTARLDVLRDLFGRE